MPEIKPDRSDTSRCTSVHWTLPVQCVLPRSHRENWHETWHETGNRLRYRHTVHTTQELRNSQWHDLQIPAPGDICGEPRQGKPDVHCQAPRTHNQTSWTHRAVVDGCTYTWHTIRRNLTAEQERHDMAAFRRLAAEQATEIQRLQDVIKQLTAAADEDPATCESCGHLESAHDPDGDRDCHASGARVTDCSCTWFIPCYPAPANAPTT